MTDSDLKNLLEVIIVIGRRASLINVNMQAIIMLMRDPKGIEEMARMIDCPYAGQMRNSLDLLEKAVRRGEHLAASLIDAAHTASGYAGLITDFTEEK